ncbi:MAG: DUF6597 domain-containing transcriptional factor [Bacteroidales bacterium]
MQFNSTGPNLILAPYVKTYWAMDHSFTPNEPHSQRIVPTGLTELVFYFGNPPRSSDPGKGLEDNVLLSGQQTTPFDLEISQGFSLFSVVFRPEGINVFFDLPCDELTDRHLPLRFILKNETSELEARLWDAGNFRERVGLIEVFLLKRLGKLKRQYDLQRISHSVLLISNTRGNLGVDRLASEACLSRKQYERTFLHNLGVSPKKFIRTIRFQHTLDQKNLCPGISLTALAHHCGYYDQSHMIREFKTLSGLTPSEYFSGCTPYSDYYQ